MKCEKNMSFEECELAILRSAVDKAEAVMGQKLTKSENVMQIIAVVEKFLRDKGRVCYGGTAINNILPKEEQFYDKNIEIPDYDFFSPKPIKDAKELADIFYALGFNEVEAKAGVHFGTYKVFVNFIPVADITYMDPKLYKGIFKESIQIAGIHYCPPNLLRMMMYLELSRPKGDVSRWEKVLKRLTLLNKNYPLKGKRCYDIEIQRSFENTKTKEGENEEDTIFYITRDTFINQGLVFFGAMANKLYSMHMPKKITEKFKDVPDFDVLSEDPETSAVILRERLKDSGIPKKDIHIIRHDKIGEMVAEHLEIKVRNETIAFIYKPLACHSYNVVHEFGKKIRVATLDTMLSFYLAFIYADRKYYDKERIICMSEFLFKVQEKNRLSQKGILKRFSIDCYGEQISRENIRRTKNEMYKLLKNKRNSKKYEAWFLRYIPMQEKEKKNKKLKKKYTQKKKVKKQQREKQIKKTARQSRFLGLF